MCTGLSEENGSCSTICTWPAYSRAAPGARPGSPFSSSSPAVGVISRASIRARVDLPRAALADHRGDRWPSGSAMRDVIDRVHHGAALGPRPSGAPGSAWSAPRPRARGRRSTGAPGRRSARSRGTSSVSAGVPLTPASGTRAAVGHGPGQLGWRRRGAVLEPARRDPWSAARPGRPAAAAASSVAASVHRIARSAGGTGTRSAGRAGPAASRGCRSCARRGPCRDGKEPSRPSV